jgi:hypothetical protein
MKYGKFLTLLVLVVSILLAVECWYVAVDYERSVWSFVPILAIMFVCFQATVVSLDILTSGLVLRGFLGPMDYGYWENKMKFEYLNNFG